MVVKETGVCIAGDDERKGVRVSAAIAGAREDSALRARLVPLH